ncbi:MAG TPA: hypothetical protein PLM29_13590 [Deltaproteobacteria bacterium]|nr:hypothetical protein [Deltaproteobacteria bacterium]
MKDPELHLFILWPYARNEEGRIVQDIQERFEIVRQCEIRWSSRNFSRNLTRFYGEKLPDGSHKERHCGRGPFSLIVVRDLHPVYENRETSKGNQLVNVNLFDAKERYRLWTGGGHRVHATNTPRETRHDLALLFGRDAERYFEKDAVRFETGTVERDVPGADGWEDLEELFYVLNNTLNYIVLRNYECLPHEYTMAAHGDIDLLTENYQETVFITNSAPVFRLKHRVLNRVRIGNDDVLFDFRHVGDKYYDVNWEKDILRRRVLAPGGFYIPAPKDYFYSLLYHAAVHKKEIAPDYRVRLVEIAAGAGIDGVSTVLFDDRFQVRTFLQSYLTEHGYDFTEPIDFSVYYNENTVGRKRTSLKRRALLEILNLLKPMKSPYRFARRTASLVKERIMGIAWMLRNQR